MKWKFGGGVGAGSGIAQENREEGALIGALVYERKRREMGGGEAVSPCLLQGHHKE